MIFPEDESLKYVFPDPQAGIIRAILRELVALQERVTALEEINRQDAWLAKGDDL
jgi:hypothetical protein